MKYRETPLKIILLAFFLCFSPRTFAGNYGLNIGLGVPYLTQFGINYVDLPKNLSAEVRLNFFFTISAGIASVRLTKPEVNVKWHPFTSSFFLGIGLGHQIATATATEPSSGAGVKYSVSSSVATTTLGWLWGISDVGLFGGVDVSYQNPYHVYTTIDTAIPADDTAYTDAREAGEKFGNLGLPLITLIRIGYLY